MVFTRSRTKIDSHEQPILASRCASRGCFRTFRNRNRANSTYLFSLAEASLCLHVQQRILIRNEIRCNRYMIFGIADQPMSAKMSFWVVVFPINSGVLSRRFSSWSFFKNQSVKHFRNKSKRRHMLFVVYKELIMHRRISSYSVCTIRKSL